MMDGRIKAFKALSDETRLRILLLVSGGELCVCQMMAVLGISQPLVSRNLAVLKDAGFLVSRREKKLMFYRLRPDLDGAGLGFARPVLKDLAGSGQADEDRRSLSACREFQKATGRCDMKSFREFMRRKRAAQVKRRERTKKI
ncbi:MAG: metalloregulator ArsR/SmtB family transcription factor [Nitrospiraceae bacterium]|nr:metalloregulator ArsR/SmtB family transcription factor [Nitrospiraceae bacterium]